MSGQEMEVFAGGGQIAVGGASISAIGADIAVQTEQEFETALLQLLALDTAIGQWSLGDFMVYGREHFGERVREIVERLGETKRAKEAEKIARAFPREIRVRYMHEEMPFAFYRETAPLGTEQACLWLDHALSEHLSLAELKKAIKTGGGGQDDVPAFAAGEPESQDGWLYPLGEHRLLVGDSTLPHLLAALFGSGELASMIWTDPPYGVAYAGTANPSKTRIDATGEIANDLTPEEALEVMLGAWRAASPYLIESAPIYVAGPSGVNTIDFIQSFLDVGWSYNQTLVWRKNRGVFSRQDYWYQHESIYYGAAPGPSKGRLARMNSRPSLWQGPDSATSVFDVPLPQRSDEHPTMKPVDLIKQMILNSTEPGDIVLDLFGGSGSTLIACEATGRRCYMVEKMPKYGDVIQKRYADYIAARVPDVIDGTAVRA